MTQQLKELWRRLLRGTDRVLPDERVTDRRAARRLAGGRRSQHKEFVIIGLGRFGSSVAETLVGYGHDVLAIDADPDRVQYLSRHLPTVVHLDATNEEALRQVGAESFDIGLVSIGMDFESNLLATVHLLGFGVPRVITKARTSTQKRILERVGAHQVVLPEHEAGRRLARTLAHGHVLDYLEVSPDVDVVELRAPASLIDQRLADTDLRQRYGLTVIAIRRGDETIVTPMPHEVIERGDILVVVGPLESVEQLRA